MCQVSSKPLLAICFAVTFAAVGQKPASAGNPYYQDPYVGFPAIEGALYLWQGIELANAKNLQDLQRAVAIESFAKAAAAFPNPIRSGRRQQAALQNVGNYSTGFHPVGNAGWSAGNQAMTVPIGYGAPYGSAYPAPQYPAYGQPTVFQTVYPGWR